MISIKDAQIISDLFYSLDANVRNDLYNNRIADERDYVSRMVTHFNFPFGIFNQFTLNNIQFQSKWFSKVNSGSHERKFGCDSMLVFKVKDEIKVGLFEAKWPRIIKDPNYQWDYAQKATKTSHFTNQITRQKKWTNQAAIWEMFFYEEKVGVFNPPYDKNASTCIRHQYANKLVSSTPSLQMIWDNTDLENLIKSEQTILFNGTNQTNLKTIIFDILTCSFGKPILINPDDRTFSLTSNNEEEQVICPIIDMTTDDDSNQIIEAFMRENGISFFQQVDIFSLNDDQEAEII